MLTNIGPLLEQEEGKFSGMAIAAFLLCLGSRRVEGQLSELFS